jgi:hypothetical protein
MTLDMVCIACKKVVVVKLKFKFLKCAKPSDISSISLKLLLRCFGF